MTTSTFALPEFVGTSLFPFTVTHLPNGWGVSVAQISPELAATMLALNYEDQRSQRAGNIRSFARDMASGKWRLTHQGIAFSRRGDLFDGQNRLRAVEASGATVCSLVFFGAGGSEEMSVFDTGGVRTATDAAKVMGLDAGSRDVALVRQMAYTDLNSEKFTHAEVIHFLDRYSAAVEWVNAHVPARGNLGLSPVRAAFGRAFYHCDPDRLARFAAIYLGDVGKDNGVPSENMPVVLAKFMNGETISRAGAGAYEVRGKALRAIAAFMDGQPIATLMHSPANARLFPLPQDPKPNGDAA